MQQEYHPKEGDEKMSLSASTDTVLKKWLVRTHFIKRKKDKTQPTQDNNINNKTITHLDHALRIKLR